MRKSVFACGLSLIAIAFWGQRAIALPLRPIALEKLKYVGLDHQLGTESPQKSPSWDQAQRQALVKAVDHSLYYLNTPKAIY